MTMPLTSTTLATATATRSDIAFSVTAPVAAAAGPASNLASDAGPASPPIVTLATTTGIYASQSPGKLSAPNAGTVSDSGTAISSPVTVPGGAANGSPDPRATSTCAADPGDGEAPRTRCGTVGAHRPTFVPGTLRRSAPHEPASPAIAAATAGQEKLAPVLPLVKRVAAPRALRAAADIMIGERDGSPPPIGQARHADGAMVPQTVPVAIALATKNPPDAAPPSPSSAHMAGDVLAAHAGTPGTEASAPPAPTGAARFANAVDSTEPADLSARRVAGEAVDATVGARSDPAPPTQRLESSVMRQFEAAEKNGALPSPPLPRDPTAVAPGTAIDAPIASDQRAVRSSPAEPLAMPRARAATIGRDVGSIVAKVAASGRSSTIVIRLDPVELGRVEIRMEIDAHGKLRAVIAADQPAALDLLRRDADTLGRTLIENGFSADGATLRFETRSGGQGAGSRHWTPSAPLVPDSRGDPADFVQTPPPATKRTGLTGRVDVFA